MSIQKLIFISNVSGCEECISSLSYAQLTSKFEAMRFLFLPKILKPLAYLQILALKILLPFFQVHRSKFHKEFEALIQEKNLEHL